MSDALLLLALACVIAAVVGGGLTVAGAEIPVIPSTRRQLLLAGVGIAILVVGYALRPDRDDRGKGSTAGLPDPCVKELVAGAAGAGVWKDAKRLPGAFDVHAHPSAIAVGRRAIWIAHRDGMVTQIPKGARPRPIDPLPGVRLGRPKHEGAVGIAASELSAWITKAEDRQHGWLARIDVESGAGMVTSRPFTRPDNVAAFGGTVWVTSDTGLLTRVPPGAFPKASSIDDQHEIGGNPHGLWAGGNCVYVAMSEPNGYGVFKAETGARVRTFPLHGEVNELTAAAGALWLTGIPDQVMLRVDPKHPDEPMSTRLSRAPSGDALAAGNSGAWTADGDGTVFWVDRTGKQREFSVDGGPVALALETRTTSEVVWVVQHDAGSVSRILVNRDG